MSTTVKDPSNGRPLRRPALERSTAMRLAADEYRNYADEIGRAHV